LKAPGSSPAASSGLISGFAFRIVGFVFRVPDSRFRVSGFGLLVPGSGFRISGFRSPAATPNIDHERGETA